jgi:hypothetical protein
VFITVSLGGMLAVAATAAATGAFAGLYVRAKTVKLAAKARSMVGILDKDESARRWKMFYKKMSMKYPVR